MNDKITFYLTAFIAFLFFATGLLGVLNNYITISILTTLLIVLVYRVITAVIKK